MEKFGCTVDKISQVHFLVERNLTVLGYLSSFSKVFETCWLLQCSTSILATFVHLISDLTLQGTGCFRRPSWFGGNESNRRKFTVPSKWVKKNKKDAMIQWDDDTMLSMCQWVFFTSLIEMHPDFLPLVHSDVVYIDIFLAHLVVVRSVQFVFHLPSPSLKRHNPIWEVEPVELWPMKAGWLCEGCWLHGITEV